MIFAPPMPTVVVKVNNTKTSDPTLPFGNDDIRKIQLDPLDKIEVAELVK